MNRDIALAESAGQLLKSAGLTLAVAESCTGGLLGALLTEVAGSSAYFLGGVISYADSIKINLLGVPANLIREHGAVSAESALSMSNGARLLLGADLALSITGVAGPGGGSDLKPVGTTYIALTGPTTQRIEHRVWQGDRSANRQDSARMALQMLLEYLTDDT